MHRMIDVVFTEADDEYTEEVVARMFRLHFPEVFSPTKGNDMKKKESLLRFWPPTALLLSVGVLIAALATAMGGRLFDVLN